MYAGHKSDDGRIQSLLDHLNGTSQLAGRFGRNFGAEQLAAAIGLAHDIGKYSEKFQQRLLANGAKVDHSTAGAIEMSKTPGLGLPPAYCIAGHHGGLPDGGSKVNTASDITLHGRLKRDINTGLPDYTAFQKALQLNKAPYPSLQMLSDRPGFSAAFFIRMLFSCLVDADFLDTETFMRGEQTPRGNHDAMETLLQRLHTYIAPWQNPQTPLNKKRNQILQNCLDAGERDQGLFTLTVPTGGGKTVASMAFGLTHAVKHGLDRIIYVIPYTSIIEQNASIFEEMLGEHNVLQHHSNVSYDADEFTSDENQERKKLATENWDFPVVVTTNVQFFESLFSNRPSSCRKLHNIANSIVIFDEAQMLPRSYLQLCVHAIAELALNYHCTGVLCTATQPSLGPLFPELLQPREICDHTAELYTFFRRARFERLGRLHDDTLIQHLQKHDQVLCIVNSRKQAKNLYLLLEGDGCFHLSTYMTPQNRRNCLEKIRKRLKNKQPCKVISTSLIEAGVDLDFPIVYRAQAGLDSEIQAAGRCNRENKRPLSESVVYIFDPDADYERHYPTALKTPRAMEREIAREYEDIASPEAIEAYFDRLHGLLRTGGLDKGNILEELESGARQCSFAFRTIAEHFHIIDENTKMVIIPFEEDGKEDAAKLCSTLLQGDFSRRLLRQAAIYAVNVYENEFQKLADAGIITLIDEEIAILQDKSAYSFETGLSVETQEGGALFA